MSLLDKWNKGKFSVFESEELSALKLVENINKFNGEISKEVDNKTDLKGNHLGSWQGLEKPTLSQEGIRSKVELLEKEVPQIESTLNDKIEVVDNKIKTKLDKGNVSIFDINKNLGKIDQSFLSDELLSQITGTTPISTTLADESITSTKYTDNSIGLNKIAFEHLFTWEIGSISATGTDNTSDNTIRTKKIINNSNKIKIVNNGVKVRISFYDMNGNFISNGNWLTNEIIKIDENSHFRLCLRNAEETSISIPSSVFSLVNIYEKINRYCLDEGVKSYYRNGRYTVNKGTVNSELVFKFSNTSLRLTLIDKFGNIIIALNNTTDLLNFSLLTNQMLVVNDVGVTSIKNFTSYELLDNEEILLLNVDGELKSGLWLDGIKNDMYKSLEDEIHNNYTVEFGTPLNVLEVGTNTDHCFVGDELWVFSGNITDDHTTWGNCSRYKLDLNNNTFTRVGGFRHNFGHVNSISYNASNDCLILGNGSNTEELLAEIFILKNVSSYKNVYEVNIYDYGIIIPCNDFGYKCQVVWGEDNNNNNNIIYVITNDNTIIRKLLLKRTDGIFNGQYTVLNTYTNNTKIEVNQGTCFYDGKLYTGMGHEGVFLTIHTPKSDGSIKTETRKTIFKNEDGSNSNIYTQGCEVKDGLIYMGGSDGKLRIYKI